MDYKWKFSEEAPINENMSAPWQYALLPSSSVDGDPEPGRSLGAFFRYSH